ncbi:hypothetical protein EVAR_2484_1 [Eumeta japonica]|uniref:Uncharacterized protein n=1 Tax=Eumeta variegata TaxID=151549 RepID=A0A4C1SRT8_EUMVA|nr:hypothetical protein EVAR_2484_1 [Eumeta japonica]
MRRRSDTAAKRKAHSEGRTESNKTFMNPFECELSEASRKSRDDGQEDGRRLGKKAKPFIMLSLMRADFLTNKYLSSWQFRSLE